MRTYDVIGYKGGRRHYGRDLPLEEARAFARECNGAIYRREHLHTGERFSDPSNREFLLEHWGDGHWLARGVPSKEPLGRGGKTS